MRYLNQRGAISLSPPRLPALGADFRALLARPPKRSGDNAIRPFRVDLPEDALVDLRRRIAMTRWPERETVGDESQGVQLAAIQEVARYWGTDYDWRKCEAKLNALPQFITTIDGLAGASA
jgi:hypothetical protein